MSIKQSLWCSIGAALCAVIVTGCATTQYGIGWLTNGERSTRDGYGAFVNAQLMNGSALEGEVVAASNDSLFLIAFNEEVRTFEAIARATIQHIIGNRYIESADQWQTDNSAARVSRIEYESGDDADAWDQLRIYSRFPAGLPAAFDRAHPKTRAVHVVRELKK